MHIFRITMVAFIFLVVPLSGNAASDDMMQQEVSGSISIENAEQLIRDAYHKILKRAPDESGLETYKDYLLRKGKDADWLRHELRNSQEGRNVRKYLRKQRMVMAIILLGAIVLAILFRSLVLPSRKLPPETRDYLIDSIRISPVTALLMLLYVYTYFKSTHVFSWILYGIFIFAMMTAIRLPRWLVYNCVLVVMVALIGWGSFVDAKGSHDRGSDRDDGVEISASMLMQGSNPWNERTQLNLRITTGPSSILLAVPFVALFGEINALTFIMWTCFLIFILAGDVAFRNNTFATIIMLLLFPWSGFLHTLHWSLDELYYGAILLPVLWLALRRNRLIIAGLLGAFICLVRLSYAPMVFAAGLWWMLERKRAVKDYLRIAAGGLLYCSVAVSVFMVIGGSDFITNNFWHNSQMQSLDDTTNVVTTLLSTTLGWLPTGPLGSMVIIIPLIVISGIAMRRGTTHPFYQISIAGLLGHSIAFSPDFRIDYQLILLIPALYSIAFTEQTAKCKALDRKVIDDFNKTMISPLTLSENLAERSGLTSSSRSCGHPARLNFPSGQTA